MRQLARPCLILCLLVAWLRPAFGQDEDPGFMLGVEVFLSGYTHLVRGKRVALLTNQTGRDRHGRATIDLLNNHPDVNLVRLFSPEHGIRGTVEAGRKIADTVDDKTGLPIISLYGGEAGFRPKKAHLAGVDVVIYDIQDVGSRAYTYIWSMAEAMTACGEQGAEMMVFDRPCPYGADTIDGPVCDTRYNSLLTRFALPRVYGMTVGELARYFNRKHNLQCRLTVIPMAGYERGMTFEETAQPWVGPSPNIPDLSSARLFPATGTLGLTGQVHIGIGTNCPFQLVGAPWLDAEQTAADLNGMDLPGVVFQATEFVSDQFFKGKRIKAVLMRVADSTEIQPATIELVLLIYLSRMYPRQFVWETKRQKAFDRAMGTADVRKAIQRGDSFEDIQAYWRRQQEAFRKDRRRYLIYKRRPPRAMAWDER